MKKIISLLLLLVLAFSLNTSYAASPISIYLDDVQLDLASPPVVLSGVTLVPVSDILNPLGADITWIASTKTVIAKKDGIEMKIVIGDSFATLNGAKVSLASPAKIINGKTMLPLKFVSESLGYNVQWDGVKREITIDSRISGGTKVFYDGMYKVGADINPGLYKIISSDTAYVERSKDSTGNFDSINGNALIEKYGYFRITAEDAYVTVNDGKFFEFDIPSAVPKLLTEIKSGVYLVGIDIAPGEYKFTVDDSTYGYISRLSDVNEDIDSIISNDLYQTQGYIEILPTDFAIRISDCTLTPVK